MVPTLRIRYLWFAPLLAAIAFLLTVSPGCRSLNESTDPTLSTVHTTIAGKIINESGNPMSGVTVTAGAKSATTDANGLFFIPNVTTNSEHASAIAKAPGYFNGARTAQPTPDGVTYMYIAMVPETAVGTIDATTGGSVSFADGAKVALQAGGVVTSSGTPYTGTVTVFAAHLNPSDPAFAKQFPGDLSAQTAHGKATILRTYGVMMGELKGSNGEMLQPASGMPAQITVPIPASLQPSATASIPLWYFDETLGQWKEEGSATNTNNTFVGNVAHFTAWNCDYSGPWGEIHGRVVCGGNGAPGSAHPVPGVVVSLGAMSAGGQPMVTTNANGEFTARVPAEWAKFEYQVLAGNNDGLYYTSASVHITIPANTTTELGDIVLDSPCPSFVSGTVRDCDGKPTAAMVIAKTAGGAETFTYSVNGDYRLGVGAGLQVTLTATSVDGHVAQPQTITGGTEDQEVTGQDIIACQEASEYFIDMNGDFGPKYGYEDPAFSPDGTKLAVVEGSDVVIYNAPSWTQATVLQGMSGTPDSVREIHFSPDGSKLLVVHSGGSSTGYEVWSVTGTKISTHVMPVQDAVFDATSTKVVGITYKTVTMFDLDGNPLSTTNVTGQDQYLESAVTVIAPDGKSNVIVGYNAIYLWDPTTQTLTNVLTTAGYGWYSRMSYDGHVIGIVGNGLHFYDMQTLKELSAAAGVPATNGGYAITPDDANYVAQYSSGSAYSIGFFSIADGTPVHMLEADQSLGVTHGMAIAPGGKHVVALYTGRMRIWTLK